MLDPRLGRCSPSRQMASSTCWPLMTTRSDLRLPDGELGDEIRRVFEQTGELLVDVLNVEGAREEIVRIR